MRDLFLPLLVILQTTAIYINLIFNYEPTLQPERWRRFRTPYVQAVPARVLGMGGEVRRYLAYSSLPTYLVLTISSPIYS